MNREESKQLAKELEKHKPSLVICGGEVEILFQSIA